MCDPTTALIGIAAGGSLLQIHGNLTQADYAEEAGAYNQAIAMRNAAYQRQRTKVDVARMRREQGQAKSQYRAAFGGSGISVHSDSVIEGILDLEEQTDYDVALREYEGRLAEMQALETGQMAAFQGQREAYGHRISAFSSLLSGAGQIVGITA
jgi:hypothetical protein